MLRENVSNIQQFNTYHTDTDVTTIFPRRAVSINGAIEVATSGTVTGLHIFQSINSRFKLCTCCYKGDVINIPGLSMKYTIQLLTLSSSILILSTSRERVGLLSRGR